MPNGWSKKAYVQFFNCETITLKYVNMFECIKITETIYEGTVEYSY